MSVVIDPRGGGLHRPRDIDRGDGALVQEKAMESSGVEADDRPRSLVPMATVPAPGPSIVLKVDASAPSVDAARMATTKTPPRNDFPYRIR